MCQNRNPHYHRILLLTHLKNLNLFENDIVNWSLIINHSDYASSYTNSPNISSLGHFKNYLDFNNKKLIKDYKFICDIDKLCFYNENIDWSNTINTYDWNVDFKTLKGKQNFENSYINIITESQYHHREYGVHISEKSFKPFYFFQIPIFLASYNHVKMMKEEYNLHFFDDLIDHSYDDEPDDSKRFHMIVNEINRLSNMREEISLYYKSNIDKLIHNHNFIKNNNYDEIFKQYILNI